MNIPEEPITKIVTIADLYWPRKWERPQTKMEKDAMRESMAEGGIQQLFVVVPDPEKGRDILADGIRRADIAPSVGIATTGAVVLEAPEGKKPIEYAGRYRFIVNELRQDPKPSERSILIGELKDQYRINNTAASKFLGVDQDTITNWTAIDNYEPEIVAAIDAGLLTMQAARVFNGMSARGQNRVWKEEKEALCSSTGGRMHKELRAKYPPQKFRDYYKEPDKIAARLNPKPGAKTTRKRIARPSYTQADKTRTATSLEFRSAELAHLKRKNKTLSAQNRSAKPILVATLRNPELLVFVSENMRPEIQHFTEVA